MLLGEYSGVSVEIVADSMDMSFNLWESYKQGSVAQ